ncbi:MAG: response regulator transcription factor [Roseburia sp.]|nr:response regulator transcription factor [Ruminococcus sp.]MCM1154380.1 response regulator transcription factor [Roseburia sp.]MCM1243559.1 response regulator transcription factor [Roseburia sp.]
MENNVHIMLVEDDEALAGEIVSFLQKWGYMATAVRKFDDIISDFIKCQPFLVLLDVNLPYFDGFYWCRKIRGISAVPIIYISSRGSDNDKIMAIAQGGDDYVEKPFRLEVLKAKIEAVLRRTYQYKVKERIYLQDDIWFEQNMSSLWKEGRSIELTKSEKRIMEKLLERRPDIVAREELMMALWSTDEFVSDGTLTTLVSRLRDKLSAFCGSELIKTKKGQGYYIE